MSTTTEQVTHDPATGRVTDADGNEAGWVNQHPSKGDWVLTSPTGLWGDHATSLEVALATVAERHRLNMALLTGDMTDCRNCRTGPFFVVLARPEPFLCTDCA